MSRKTKSPVNFERDDMNLIKFMLMGVEVALGDIIFISLFNTNQFL